MGNEPSSIPPHIVRATLMPLSRDRLAQIADRYDLYVADRRVIADYWEAIDQSTEIGFSDLLQMLRRDELRDICAALSLDEGGVKKDLYVNRILDLVARTGQGMQSSESGAAGRIDADPKATPEPQTTQMGHAQEMTDRQAAIRMVEQICRHFDRVVKRLSKRRNGPSELIRDEHDVHNLLHAILEIHFPDIESEAWTPSHGGSSARMDLHLREHDLAIEVKIGRNGHKISEEIPADIVKYQRHPGCKTLFFLIYDPQEVLHNRRGIVRDWNGLHGQVQVMAMIVPS